MHTHIHLYNYVCMYVCMCGYTNTTIYRNKYSPYFHYNNEIANANVDVDADTDVDVNFVWNMGENVFYKHTNSVKRKRK